jgi:hypothetical protein
MIYVPKFFTPQELLDPESFAKFGADGLRYYRPEILAALDWRREHYPTKDPQGRRAMTVNNWATGGPFKFRGLRLPQFKVQGSADWTPWSGHSWGAAIDDSAVGCTPEEMRAWILEQHDAACKVPDATWKTHPVLGIRRMEIGTPTWTHTDCLEHDSEGIWMVHP